MEFDLLTIDTHYDDYWILEAVLSGDYRPKVIVHAINQQSPEVCVSVAKSDEIHNNDGSNYHGANICAFYCLAQAFDYSMVYCDSNGFYCFLVANELLRNQFFLDLNVLKRSLNPFSLFRKAGFDEYQSKKTWYQIDKCY